MASNLNADSIRARKKVCGAACHKKSNMRAGISVRWTSMKYLQPLRTRLSRLIDRYEAEPPFRLYLLAWAVFLTLVSGSVLTSSNPFRLLVPGLSYAFPVVDSREEITYYTLSRLDQRMIQLHEKMIKTGDFEQDARRLAYIVRTPFPLVQGK